MTRSAAHLAFEPQDGQLDPEGCYFSPWHESTVLDRKGYPCACVREFVLERALFRVDGGDVDRQCARARPHWRHLCQYSTYRIHVLDSQIAPIAAREGNHPRVRSLSRCRRLELTVACRYLRAEEFKSVHLGMHWLMRSDQEKWQVPESTRSFLRKADFRSAQRLRNT